MRTATQPHPAEPEPALAHINNARAMLGDDVLAVTPEADLYPLLRRVRARLDAAATLLLDNRKGL